MCVLVILSKREREREKSESKRFMNVELKYTFSNAFNPARAHSTHVWQWIFHKYTVADVDFSRLGTNKCVRGVETYFFMLA